MGHHINKDGEFKSDKYTWCPPGFFALKFTNPLARDTILYYAARTDDQELATDLIDSVLRKTDAPLPDAMEILKLKNQLAFLSENADRDLKNPNWSKKILKNLESIEKGLAQFKAGNIKEVGL